MLWIKNLKLSMLTGLFVIGFIGCDDSKYGLADKTYKGDPLAVIDGHLYIDASDNIGKSIQLAIAWTDEIESFLDESLDEKEYADPGEDCEEWIWDYPLPIPDTCDGSLSKPFVDSCTSDSGAIVITQAVTFEAAAFIDFSLPLRELPPKEVRRSLRDLGGSGWLAEGFVIAFVDEDGNQKFDQSSPDKIRDRLVGSSMYEEGGVEKMEWLYYLHGNEQDEKVLLEELGIPFKVGLNRLVMDLTHFDMVSLNENKAMVLGTTKSDKNEGTFIPFQCSEVKYELRSNEALPEGAIGICDKMDADLMAGPDDIIEESVDPGVGESEDGPVIGEESGIESSSSSIEEYTDGDEQPEDWTEYGSAYTLDVFAEHVDPANPCVMVVYSGSICYTDVEQVPESWRNVCEM